MCTPANFIALNMIGSMQQKSLERKNIRTTSNFLAKDLASKLTQIDNQKSQIRDKNTRERLRANLDFLGAGAKRKALFAESGVSGPTTNRILEIGEVEEDINLSALDRAFTSQITAADTRGASLISSTQSQLNQLTAQQDNPLSTILGLGQSAISGYQQFEQYDRAFGGL